MSTNTSKKKTGDRGASNGKPSAGKPTIYEKAPRHPTKDVIGKTLAIPYEWTKVVLQVRKETDMNYVYTSLIPQFEALGRQGDPGKVILTGDPEKPYGVIGGLHRREGCRIKNWDFVATVEDIAMDDHIGQLKAALSSNVGGKPMSPFEIAAKGQELVDLGLSLVETAKLLNTSRATLSKRLLLNKLNPELQDSVLNGELSLDVACQLANFPVQEQPDLVKQFQDQESTVATEALQRLRYERGHGKSRKVNPGRKRATLNRALEVAVHSLDKVMSFNAEEIQDYFTDAPKGEEYRMARHLKAIIDMATKFEQLFTKTLGLDQQFKDQPKSAAPVVADPETSLRMLLGQAIKAGQMSAKEFDAIFKGKDPKISHQFFAGLASEASEALAALKKRILANAQQSKF